LLLLLLPPATLPPHRSKEDVKIKVLDSTLTISGERKEEKKEGETKDGKAARIERSYGSFVRSFSLPQNVDAGGIKASAKDGVLTVVIPKVEQQKPEAQEIAIEYD
jgi:HSP20 family protein